jgi:hypothetical protein
MVPQWLISLLVGLLSGGLSAYMGLKIGVAKLQWESASTRESLGKLTRRSDQHNEDLLMHDLELEDVMRKLDIPRKRRQNWRLD